MSQIHEPGEVWHIGWDWHAGMWFVEPPFDVDLDEPMLWFNERHQAFEQVDQFIREQPVQASVVDEVPPMPVEVPDVEVQPVVPKYVPKRFRKVETQVEEPQRVVTNNESAAARVDDYASRVGLG